MTRGLLESDTVFVPAWIVDLESFRRWTDDDAFPEQTQISFLAGEVWIDLSKEQVFSHNQVRGAITATLHGFVKAHRLGRYFTRVYTSNVDAGLCHQPDGLFVSAESLRDQRMRVCAGQTEIEGSPDMVLEIVSRSSVTKDTVVLRQAYATAGVREYWLVDARDDAVKFDILRLGRSGYTAPRKRAGWARSEVFGRWFRLGREVADDGYPEFTLHVQRDSP